MRPSKRATDELRKVTLERAVSRYAEGSCLVTFGDTKVLCTASLEERGPALAARLRQGLGHGRIRDAAARHARAHPPRGEFRQAVGPDAGDPAPDRPIACAPSPTCRRMGERQITVDCDVIQADGGTRTAAITGAWVALHDCFAWMRGRSIISVDPLRDHVAAVSCGIYKGSRCSTSTTPRIPAPRPTPTSSSRAPAASSRCRAPPRASRSRRRSCSSCCGSPRAASQTSSPSRSRPSRESA